jgi:hypothetical protein
MQLFYDELDGSGGSRCWCRATSTIVVGAYEHDSDARMNGIKLLQNLFDSGRLTQVSNHGNLFY